MTCCFVAGLDEMEDTCLDPRELFTNIALLITEARTPDHSPKGWCINITPDLPFLNIHNPFTNERISVYLNKHSRTSLGTKDNFVKQISYLSKGAAIAASA